MQAWPDHLDQADRVTVATAGLAQVSRPAVVYARLARRARRVILPGIPHAPLAQSAERLHGKEKVYGSIP
jgi:hypothetical protein